jgi:anti-sigma factor RsiW
MLAMYRAGGAFDGGRVRGRKMSCRDTIHLICWYLEGKLSPSVASEIEKHLSECPDCHVVLDAANTTLDRYFGPVRAEETAADPKAA